MANEMKPNPTGNYITQITLPSGTTYELVDENARKELNLMSSYTAFLGVTTTDINDGTTAASVIIGGETVVAVTGNIVIKNTDSTTAGMKAQEYIYTGNTTGWQLFGDISAQNLGNLAYSNSASSTAKFLKSVSINNNNTASISVTGLFTPQGEINLSTTQVTYALTTTSTKPSVTANCWIYNPSDNLSVTASVPSSTSTTFLTGITGRTLIEQISTAAPSVTAETGEINLYASVTSHTLQLNKIIVSTTNAISATSTKKALTGVSAPTINKSGTTQYISPLTVTVVTSASFSGTASTVTSSGLQKIAGATSSSATVIVQ